MRYRFQCRFFIYSVLTVCLFATTINAGSPNSQFNATIFFSEQVVPTGSFPCVLAGNISGNGVATQIGGLTAASTDCITPVPPSFVFSSNQVVLTTANGDQIWIAYHGTLSSAGTISGLFTIYGGTGRLANATGSGSIDGVETIDQTTGTGTGQVRFTGTWSH
jgi:hypothetical protein